MKIFLLFFIRLWLGGEIVLTIMPLGTSRFYPVHKPDPYVGSMPSHSSRYRETIPFKKKGEYRIIMLGGSSVWGGHDLKNAIPFHLEKYFIDKGYRSVRVYNFGVVSSVARQQLHFLFEDVVDKNPDLVVFYNGANAVMQPAFWDPRPGYPSDFFVLERGVELIKGEYGILEIGTLFLMKSKVVRLIPYFREYVLGVRLTQITSLREESKAGTDDWRQKISVDYAGAMEKAHQMGISYGFDVAVFLQPLVNFKQPIHENEELIGFHYASDHTEKTYDAISSLMNEISNKNKNLIFVDLRNLFEGINDHVFQDHVHIYDSFKRLVAKVLFDKLEPLVRK